MHIFSQRSASALFVCLACCQEAVQGATIGRRTDAAARLSTRQSAYNATETQPYSLPPSTADVARAEALETTRAGFLYGDPVAGGPFYPAGPLGTAAAQADYASLEAELNDERALASSDMNGAIAAFTAKGAPLSTLDDYSGLYEGQYKLTLPSGPAPGILANYTSDLLFSMERLSTSPYAVRRLSPSSDTPGFAVDDDLVRKISGGSTLSELLAAGRLFYVDHSAQGKLERSSTSYAGACDAYFFLHPTSNSFLPLAIRTGVGANLVYTPLESDPADWLLAKMVFNTNDVFFAQFNHLAATHEVVQIVWMAAVRSLSASHPVHGVLERLMYQVLAVQPIARDLLFAEGASVDNVFGFTGAAAQVYTDSLYHGGQGDFQANYFLADLKSRGLISDDKSLPKLPSFPFYEDALVIYTAIRGFMTAFVSSYYPTDADVLSDSELQSWAVEAGADNAKAYDFPSSIPSKETLIDILTHMAHLGSTAHHAVNTNELLSASLTLPFHPGALYAPLPTTKGISGSDRTNLNAVVSYLPPFAKCLAQLLTSGSFARPLLFDTDRTLTHMFDSPAMLARMNDATNSAAAIFQKAMEVFSGVVRARGFDGEGLSQGMPFVWRGLDPNAAPFSVTI